VIRWHRAGLASVLALEIVKWRAPCAAAQLMSEGGILCFKSTIRFERRGQQRQKEAE